MKNIIGLDLGVTSIGWAVVKEAESNDEQSSITAVGVRVNPLAEKEGENFIKGKAIATNSDRTLARSARRNLHRFKLRREALKSLLITNSIMSENLPLSEQGSGSTHYTYKIRAKAASEQISLDDLCRVLLMINSKRGYKSGRKTKSSDEGEFIDGMDAAIEMYEKKLTPGEFMLDAYNRGVKKIGDFYRSDLLAELQLIFEIQRNFHPDLLDDEVFKIVCNKGKREVVKLFYARFGINVAENKEKDKKLQALNWRVAATKEPIEQEQLVYVISDICGTMYNGSSLLGAIGDRSKELYINNQTIGEYLYEKLKANPLQPIKGSVFFRQDYLDEFETIWECQSKYYPQLTKDIKSEIRDVVIFYQRPLKSQKHLISYCELESKEQEIDVNGKRKIVQIGSKVAPKSSPLFQEFKMWQIINNIKVSHKIAGKSRSLTIGERNKLAKELTIKGTLKTNQVIELLFGKRKELSLNYNKEILGNNTISLLFAKFNSILELSDNGVNVDKLDLNYALELFGDKFTELGYNIDLLKFDSSKKGKQLETEPLYKLWHLLYSYQGDNSKSGQDKLIEKIKELTKFDYDGAEIIASIDFSSDYSSLSSKAISNLLPFMKEGAEYSDACTLAGYNHSKSSLTKEQINSRELKDQLSLLPRNSLRNPVVEKILNQMINVVNALVVEYGRPDEFRIEMSRDLKSSAKERESASSTNETNRQANEKCLKIIKTDFGISNPSRNDIIRYKLYEELSKNGYKTLYSGKEIEKSMLFTDTIDIEHIIPQTRYFDDSFSNKTLEFRSYNIEKSSDTAYDYILKKFGKEAADNYCARVDDLAKAKAISSAKATKLKMREEDIPDGCVERDLRNTQYIAKKACEILLGISRHVVHTSGMITARLRDDWQLVDVMKELNWDKFDTKGMTSIVERRTGNRVRVIEGWSKRNDHRHHAMDALTVAFTKHSHVNYLNYLNARKDGNNKRHFEIIAIEQKELYRNDKNKLLFKSPFDRDSFREEAQKALSAILVSHKAKNKVVTTNINKIKVKGRDDNKQKHNPKMLTPRGKLHKETVYGVIDNISPNMIAINGSLTANIIETVCSPSHKKALFERLEQFNGDVKKAFTGKNAPSKKPILCDNGDELTAKVKVFVKEQQYTIRKAITPDLKIEKVIDCKVRMLLEQRLAEFGGDAKKAFINLDENPIWYNKEHGISIKRVKIRGVNNAIPVHSKRDKDGKYVVNNQGDKVATDFVSSGNNHHVAIFMDEKGKLQEQLTPFFDAVTAAINQLPVIDRSYGYGDGWRFIFTLKQNEYFVFPRYKYFEDDEGNIEEQIVFDPSDIDLLNPDNYALISPSLYRVQKITTKDYVFRHHLESTIDDDKRLKDTTWKRIRNLENLRKVVKVRVDNIGRIVSIGEY